MKIFILFIFSRVLFGQAEYIVPFDWGGQNGVLVHDGALHWNRSWTSGVLLFDGTYSTYPKKYGNHTSNRFNSLKIGSLPTFKDAPDSTQNISYFDYYRGDYNYDQLGLGVNYESKNQYIHIKGFKRSLGGNTGHYFHPSGKNSPIHHSYRIDYGVLKKGKQIEAGVGRYITTSGLPDSTQNGLENENIITAGIRIKQSLGNWKLNTHFANFQQRRLIHHTSFIDTNYRDINRSLLNLQIESKNGKIIGLQHQTQNINSNIDNRRLAWTKIYGKQTFKKFSLLGGVQLLNSDDVFPFVWEFGYSNQFNKVYLELLSNGSQEPKHPDLDDSNDMFSFDYWNRATLKMGVNSSNLNFSVYLSTTKRSSKVFKGSSIIFVGGDLTYSYQNGWSLFSSITTQLDTSSFGAGGGTYYNTGINGKAHLFNKNMNIDLKLWVNGTEGRNSKFGFDPIRHVPFLNTNSSWVIPDQWLIHFEAKANISSVLVHYKINNILNALGATNDDNWFRPNHVFPQLGRMVQFGVTWYFKN